MNIPDFPECQTPAPSISDEPEAKLKSNPLHSRSSRLDDENPCTPGKTSTTSAPSTMQTKASFRLWVPEEAEEEQSPPREQMAEVDDDGVPINRSDSFRNLSTLIAWERIEGIHAQQNESNLTRQKPQPTLDLSKCDIADDTVLPGSPFAVPRFNNGDTFNNQNSLSAAVKNSEIQSELERDDYSFVEEGGKTEKTPFRTRFFRKLRKFRNRKKDKTPRWHDP